MVYNERVRATTDVRFVANFEKTVERFLDAHKEEVNAAHNINHLTRVANTAYQIVVAIGSRERMSLIERSRILKLAELAAVGGLCHDLKRAPTEVLSGVPDDEKESQKAAGPILDACIKEGFIDAGEKGIILASILTKSVVKDAGLLGEKPEEGRKRQIDDRYYLLLHENEESLVRFAVWAADKIDANGLFVAGARRPQFVGGDRLFRDTGDLRKLKAELQTAVRNPVPTLARDVQLAKQVFGNNMERFDSEMAVLLESYIRLGVKNNPKDYPEWFQPVVKHLFDQQLDFVHALMAHRGRMEGRVVGLLYEDLAQRLMMTDFPGVKPEEIFNWEKNRPREETRKLIEAVPQGKAEAAFRMLKFFSNPERINTDTAELIREFVPETEQERLWHGQMLQYLEVGIRDSLSLIMMKRP